MNVDLPDDAKLPSKEVGLMLFRVLQESLTNVLRHAQATAVDITLAQEQKRLVLTISDNGKGLPPGALESFKQGVALGVGLAGKRERLAEFGGTLELESSSSVTKVSGELAAVRLRSAIPITHPMITSLKTAHFTIPSTRAVEVKKVGVDTLRTAKNI